MINTMGDQIFNKHLLEKACQDFGLWNKFRLLFKPTNYSYDDGCLIKFKELDGHIFITQIKYTEQTSHAR